MSMFRPTAARSLGDLVKRQREELQKKDATIKALADALEVARERDRALPFGRSPLTPSDVRQINAALRLAGRL